MPTQLVVTNPKQLAVFEARLVEDAQLELAEAEQDFEAARRRGGHIGALQRAAGRVMRAEMQVKALQQGFLPVPRMPIQRLTQWRAEQLNVPLGAEERLAEALALGVFERVAIVAPLQRGRDPLLIGVIGRGATERHFLIAWWI